MRLKFIVGEVLQLKKVMKFFRSLKIVTKISILSSVSFVFIIYIGFIGMKSVADSHKMMDGIINADLAQLSSLQDIKENFLNIQTKVISLMGESDLQERATLEDEMSKMNTSLKESLNKYKSTLNSNNTNALEAAFGNFDNAKNAFIEFDSQQAKMMEASPQAEENPAAQPQNNGDGMGETMKDFQTGGDTVVSELNKLIQKHNDKIDGIYNNSSEMNRHMMMKLAQPVLICIVLSFLLSFITIRSIVVPVKKVTARLTEITESNGDLTQRIAYDSKDEIGLLSRGFDNFVDKLQHIIKEVAVSADAIAASSRRVSDATSDTNAAFEQISQAVTGIAGGTSGNADLVKAMNEDILQAAKFSESTALVSKKTSEYSLKVKELAEDGNGRVNEIVVSIQNIANSTKEVNALINGLGVSMDKIGEIVQLITGIADQTNLLALNAAIEAARAGEAGKGFNVVAGEIRKLAEESNNAAKKIIIIADDNRNKAAEAVRSVSRVEETVAGGVEKGADAATSINSIINNVTEIADQIKEIDDATRKQAVTMAGMTDSMNNMAGITQEAAASIEQISASIQEQTAILEKVENAAANLAEMAKKLDAVTSGFKV